MQELQHVVVVAKSIVFEIGNRIRAISKTVSINVGVAATNKSVIAMAALQDVDVLCTDQRRGIVVDLGDGQGDVQGL